MFRRFGIIGALLALFVIAGGHWGVLQTVAWTEMLHEYTQRTGSVSLAVAQTFDGSHPCELCREIARAKSPAKPGGGAAIATAAKDAAGKAVAAAGTLRLTRVSTPGCTRLADPVCLGLSRRDAPPTPPPRSAGAAV